MKSKFLLIGLLISLLSCTNNAPKETVSGYVGSKFKGEKEPANGLKVDSVFEVNPRNVLLTGNSEHLLTPMYKVNYRKKSNTPYTGTNQFYQEYSYYNEEGKPRWNNHHLPGYEIVSGFNMVNISHFNVNTGLENILFDAPVLIRNFYYPTFKLDTLNGAPVLRKNYFASVYDQDTNGDGYITPKDKRRFYCFDIEGKNKEELVPLNCTVTNSEYDPANDRMYIFASDDKNNNGEYDYEDPKYIFWVDLKNPKNRGVQYSAKKSGGNR